MKTNIIVKTLKTSILLLSLCFFTAYSQENAVRYQTTDGKYTFYFGDLHSHTIYSGDRAKGQAARRELQEGDMSIYDPKHGELPRHAFAEARRLGLDFFAVTDHSNVRTEKSTPNQQPQNWWYENGFTEAHWQETMRDAKSAAENGKFIAIHGYEYSNNDSKNEPGHMNVFNTEKWESALPEVNNITWWLEEALPLQKANEVKVGSKMVAQFNHAGLKQYDNYLNLVNPRSVEMNGKPGKNYNQYVRLKEVNLKRLPTWQKLLNLGWKIAPVNNSDVHGVPGIKNNLKFGVGVLATELTLEAVMDALYERRVFGVWGSPGVHLEFRVNGVIQGTEFEKRPAGNTLAVDVFALNSKGTPVVKVEIMGGNYAPENSENSPHQVLSTIEFGASIDRGKTTVPNTYDFYYALLYMQPDQSAAATAPIWMDNL